MVSSPCPRSKTNRTMAIEGMGPVRVFPVHTESPELFREHFEGVVVPVVGEEYRL